MSVSRQERAAGHDRSAVVLFDHCSMTQNNLMNFLVHFFYHLIFVKKIIVLEFTYH